MAPAVNVSLPVPAVARVITTSLLMFTLLVLAFCMTRRMQNIRSFRRLQVPQWLVLAIYMDSLLFIITTAILTKSFDLNTEPHVCDGAILLCILCYMSTKVLLYYFLVEKVYIIRNPWESRLKDKLYLFNVFGVILPYVGLVILAFIYRISYIDPAGKCVIGINKEILFPLTAFEMGLNVYLTSLFMRPLKKLYSDDSTKHTQGGAKAMLKTMAMRTFIGSCATLVSTSVNLGVLAGLEGERGWICLMLCNLDILFAVSVLHWATSLDKRIDEDGTRGQTTMNKTSATMDSRTYRAESVFSSTNPLRSLSGVIPPCNPARRPSAVLSWEDMELNEIALDDDDDYSNNNSNNNINTNNTKLGNIIEEVDVTPKDVKDVV